MFAMTGIGGGEILLVLVALLLVPIGLAAMAFWIWMLVHAIRNPGLNEGEKIAWVLVIALVHFLGAVIYFFAGRPKANVPIRQPSSMGA